MTILSNKTNLILILNNQCQISRPEYDMRYIFTVSTLNSNNLVCRSMSFEDVIEGALLQIQKVKKEYNVLPGNWLSQYHWDLWFESGGFQAKRPQHQPR